MKNNITNFVQENGIIHLNNGEEIVIEQTGDEITTLNEYDVDTVDGNIISYDDLPTETLEEIEKVIEDKKEEQDKTIERTKNENW